MSRQDYSHKAREYQRKRDDARVSYEQNLDAIEAASVFAQRLSKRVDAWAGPDLVWHVWAITAAFLAGVQHAKDAQANVDARENG